jgi:hypothetical protein
MAEGSASALSHAVTLIDWVKAYPLETPRQIAVRQSIRCLCAETKQIGEAKCASCRALTSPAYLAERWGRPRVAYDYNNLRG